MFTVLSSTSPTVSPVLVGGVNAAAVAVPIVLILLLVVIATVVGVVLLVYFRRRGICVNIVDLWLCSCVSTNRIY